MLKITVCQTEPKLLNLQANLEEVIDKIKQAKENGSELVVFPELALTGYFVGNRYHDVALRLDSKEVKTLAKATKGTAAIVGLIEESLSMNFYNSALVLIDGEIQFAYRKIYLPNYGAFEEAKYFASGKKVLSFKLKEFHLAVFICNDVWHPSLPSLGITQKADVFVTIVNSSHGSMGTEFSNIETWGIINTFYSRVFGIYGIFANRVGDEMAHIRKDQFDCEQQALDNRFWGGSEIINPFGLTICKAALYEQDTIEAEISSKVLRQKKILLPYVKNDNPYFTARELERILIKSEPQL